MDQYVQKFVQSLSTSRPKILVGGSLAPSEKNELEKKKIAYFSSLEALDEYFAKS